MHERESLWLLFDSPVFSEIVEDVFKATGLSQDHILSNWDFRAEFVAQCSRNNLMSELDADLVWTSLIYLHKLSTGAICDKAIETTLIKIQSACGELPWMI